MNRGIAWLAVLVMLCAIFSAFGTSSLADRGDGYLLYGEGVVATPRYRTWTNLGNSLGAEQTGATTAASIRHTIMEQAPTRNELLAGAQTTGGILYIQRWNGTAWSNEWNVTVGNNNLPRFDIAYERKSGRAVVFYTANVGTANEIQYRTWDGTVWSLAQNYDPIRTTGIVDSIKAVSQKASNYIGVAWGDRNFDLSADFWDGDTNSFVGEPAVALSTNLSKVGAATSLTNQSFDIAFENASNELLLAWGNDTIQDLQYVTRGAGTSGSWVTVSTNTTFPEEPTDMQLVSEPNTDYIAYVNASDNQGDGDRGIWTGSAWTVIGNYDTSIDTVALGTKNVSGAWVLNGAQSRFVLTYDDANAAGIDWSVYNKNINTWANQTDYTTAPAPVGTNDFMHRMYSNPFAQNEAILIVVDAGRDLFMKKLTFNGTTLTWTSVEGGASPEATISVNNGFAADFAYSRFITPATLGVDVVDASGATVPSPSVLFGALNTSFTCQTNNATLGTASEKLRVGNGTANELWTLSIGATAGVNANWSNGSTGQYDYNDSAGAPAGCADGVDADSLPGRLSVDASTATITTPQYDCDITGVSKGGASAFVQGVTDAITIANTSSSAIANCDFDLTDIDLNQQVPAERPTGNYSINMTITVTAN
jgi:hypothetical protein